MNKYLDNPQSVKQWIESLSPSEKALFDQGYLAALGGLIEQLRDSKIKILNRLHQVEEMDETENIKANLTARLRILEIYDEYYEKIVNNLSKQTQSQLLPSSEKNKI